MKNDQVCPKVQAVERSLVSEMRERATSWRFLQCVCVREVWCLANFERCALRWWDAAMRSCGLADWLAC
eukprot:768721-Rhodomonas_salina.2